MVIFQDLSRQRKGISSDKYFQIVTIISFDIINHVSKGDPLDKSYNRYFAVKADDFKKYPGPDKANITGGALRNQSKSKCNVRHFLFTNLPKM